MRMAISVCYVSQQTATAWCQLSASNPSEREAGEPTSTLRNSHTFHQHVRPLLNEYFYELLCVSGRAAFTTSFERPWKQSVSGVHGSTAQACRIVHVSSIDPSLQDANERYTGDSRVGAEQAKQALRSQLSINQFMSIHRNGNVLATNDRLQVSFKFQR